MRISPVLILTAMMAASFLVLAQQGGTLRVDVELVNVVATVTDSEGRYVTDLTRNDFVVEDAGVPQEIVHFTHDRETAIRLGVLIDTSASMARRMRTALTAVDRFAGTLVTSDRVFVATFSDRVSLLKQRARDTVQLSRTLEGVRVSGGTALYDAIVVGIKELEGDNRDKRALLVLTDGSDTASNLDLGDTLEAIRGSEVLIYPLGINPIQFADSTQHVPFEWPTTPIPGAPDLGTPRNDDPVDLQVLESLAEASGGKAFLVTSTWAEGTASEIDRVLDEVSAELRNQYTIGYYPSMKNDGRFHEIRIRIKNGKDYTVRTRNGYRSQAKR